MPVTKVLYGHELTDLVDEQSLFDAADLNGISITEALTPGEFLTIPLVKGKQLINELIKPRIKPTSVKAVSGQTWVDLVLQQLGDEERIFELCDNNGAGITDEIEPGRIIICPNPEASKNKIVNVLRDRKPSSIFYGTGNPAPEGIEYWEIELDFVVS